MNFEFSLFSEDFQDSFLCHSEKVLNTTEINNINYTKNEKTDKACQELHDKPCLNDIKSHKIGVEIGQRMNSD